MPIGRNDPCPCGSGKKYKRCHGALTIETNPNVARANELKSVDMDLTPRLLHFAKSRFGPAWLPDAFAHYAGSEDAEIPEHEWSLAIPWALYLRCVDGARTLAEEWAAEHGRRATDVQRTVLRAYSNAWLSIWKVTRVERGVGVALTDQLTREERFAYDKSASGMLTLHDALLAIIIDCDGVSFFGGVHPQPLPPQYAQSVLRDARRLCRVRTRAVDPERLHDNDVQLDLVDSWNITVDAMLGAPPPTLTNTDGDLFALTTDDFELTAPRDAVVDRLASMAGASPPEQENGDMVIVFTKSGNSQQGDWSNTVIGRAIVGARSLRLETNSARRADALRSSVEQRLAGMVHYRLRQETNTSELLARARTEAKGDAAPEPQPPEIAAMLRDFREKHMRGWVDESIPALGGLTPRGAARTPRARPALELLLQDIERTESTTPPEQRIDLSWLRRELGFESPS